MQKESKSPTSAEETHNNNYNSKLIDIIKLEDHEPFTAVRKGEQWYLMMGKYRLSEAKKTYEEVLADAANTTWLRIMQVMRIVIMDREEEKQLRDTIDKQQQKLEFDRFADQNEADLENKTSL